MPAGRHKPQRCTATARNDPHRESEVQLRGETHQRWASAKETGRMIPERHAPWIVAKGRAAARTRTSCGEPTQGNRGGDRAGGTYHGAGHPSILDGGPGRRTRPTSRAAWAKGQETRSESTAYRAAGLRWQEYNCTQATPGSHGEPRGQRASHGGTFHSASGSRARRKHVCASQCAEKRETTQTLHG